jgi:hypothetical protein
MTTLDISTWSRDLAQSLAAIEEELSSAAVAGSKPANTDPFGLNQQLSEFEGSQARLIAVVRALRVAAVGEAVGTERNGLFVEPLATPDRITKRDYNYFDDLNAALKELHAQAT